MNSTGNCDNNARNAGEEKLGERMEKKCEDWVKDIDKKADSFTKKMPAPANAFLDALCLSILITVVIWICRKMGWIEYMPTWAMLGIVFGAIFAVSLLCRLLVKNRK